jgi:hypothetical protein
MPKVIGWVVGCSAGPWALGRPFGTSENPHSTEPRPALLGPCCQTFPCLALSLPYNCDPLCTPHLYAPHTGTTWH